MFGAIAIISYQQIYIYLCKLTCEIIAEIQLKTINKMSIFWQLVIVPPLFSPNNNNKKKKSAFANNYNIAMHP